MEYIIEHDKIKTHNIIFKLPIKNQNEKYINFYKILFSNKNITLKYIILKLSPRTFHIQQDCHRYKILINRNDEFIKNIENVEKRILSSINNTVNKNIICNLSEDINGKPHLYTFLSYPDLNHFYIKISGIWETENCIGLTFKFIYS